jgi:hypothetical protein
MRGIETPSSPFHGSGETGRLLAPETLLLEMNHHSILRVMGEDDGTMWMDVYI